VFGRFGKGKWLGIYVESVQALEDTGFQTLYSLTLLLNAKHKRVFLFEARTWSKRKLTVRTQVKLGGLYSSEKTRQLGR